MQDRRLEPRLLCSDLVHVHWTDASGQDRSVLANLEDISNSGACLQMDTPIPCETLLRLVTPKADLEGRVRYCVFRDVGYLLGVRFEPPFRWSPRRFKPKHLLDPRRLMGRPKLNTGKEPEPSQ